MTITLPEPAQIRLSLLPVSLAVCQLPSQATVPTWLKSDDLLAVIRTKEELTIVCDAECVPAGVVVEAGWRCWKVQGPLDFSLVGVLAGLANALAQAGVSIFVVSTYATDYILVKNSNLSRSREALMQKGYQILGAGDDEAYVNLSS